MTKTPRERVVEAPWYRTFYRIKSRTENPKDPSYSRYGGKGIKCLITKNELKKLWFRDKAYLLDRPSIDRINSKGNYIYKNCRYIELSKNAARDILLFCKNGHERNEINSRNRLDKFGHKRRTCRICLRKWQREYRKMLRQKFGGKNG